MRNKAREDEEWRRTFVTTKRRSRTRNAVTRGFWRRTLTHIWGHGSHCGQNMVLYNVRKPIQFGTVHESCTHTHLIERKQFRTL